MISAAAKPSSLVTLRSAARLRGLRIGLLGGAFNPPHAGHVYLSRWAQRAFDLHEIWWVMSLQHRFKPELSEQTLEPRLAAAARLIASASTRIRLSLAEDELRTYGSHALIKELVDRFRDTRFIWLMGSDNLATIHRWERWQDIFETIPVAILARSPMHWRALASPAARRFAARRCDKIAPTLMAPRRKGWAMLWMPRYSASSTQIRSDHHSTATKTPTLQEKEKITVPELWDQKAIAPLSDTNDATLPDITGIDFDKAGHAELLAARIHAWLDREKAENTVLINLPSSVGFADCLLITTALSSRHGQSLGQRILRGLKGLYPARDEGMISGDWVLVDAGTVVVHIFREEVRQFYNLEKLWLTPHDRLDLPALP